MKSRAARVRVRVLPSLATIERDAPLAPASPEVAQAAEPRRMRVCCCCCLGSSSTCDREETIPLTTVITEESTSLGIRKRTSLWERARTRIHRFLVTEEALGFDVHAQSPHDPLPACLLHYEHRIELLPLLPPSLQHKSWKMLFSSQEDGCSLITLYERVHDRGPTLVIVRDQTGNTFGAFAAESWRSEPEVHYHGTGDGFLFTEWPDGFRHWPWTRANRHFQLATHDCLSFGSGAHFGLFLDHYLGTGSSGRSETYGNEPLTEHHIAGGLADSPDADYAAFEVTEVQVWAFVDSKPRNRKLGSSPPTGGWSASHAV